MTPEGEVVVKIKELLEYLKLQGRLDFTRINVAGIRVAKGGRRKSEMAGFADFEVVMQGRVFYLECKSDVGKLSADQEAFRDSRVKHGAGYEVVRSVTDAVNYLARMEAYLSGHAKGTEPGGHSSTGHAVDLT